jgi:hypothetical protein
MLLFLPIWYAVICFAINPECFRGWLHSQDGCATTAVSQELAPPV